MRTGFGITGKRYLKSKTIIESNADFLEEVCLEGQTTYGWRDEAGYNDVPQRHAYLCSVNHLF